LSQLQDSGDIHPVAYASRALSATEKRYAITELETLAVMLAVSQHQAESAEWYLTVAEDMQLGMLLHLACDDPHETARLHFLLAMTTD